MGTTNHPIWMALSAVALVGFAIFFAVLATLKFEGFSAYARTVNRIFFGAAAPALVAFAVYLSIRAIHSGASQAVTTLVVGLVAVALIWACLLARKRPVRESLESDY